MKTAIQEAPCPNNLISIRENCLKLLLRSRMEMLLPRPMHLGREIIIGLIGQRGEGKSGTGASLALVDFMIGGVPCFSNMSIACEMVIEDSEAQGEGLRHGGIVTYKSQPFNKRELLQNGKNFKDSLLFVDEINVEFSEARRAMSNTNLFFNRLIQELRHYQISLIYTAISEMHIDSRLRELTDVFIKVEDTALSSENLAKRKPPGTDFKWIIYPMTRMLTGKSYTIDHKPLPPRYFNFARFRGIYDDKEVQGEGISKYGVDFSKDDGETIHSEQTIASAPKVSEFQAKWGWFAHIADELLARGEKYVRASEIYEHPEVKRHKKSKSQISECLEENYGVTTERKYVGGKKRTFYVLDDEPVEGRIIASPPVAAALTYI